VTIPKNWLAFSGYNTVIWEVFGKFRPHTYYSLGASAGKRFGSNAGIIKDGGAFPYTPTQP